MMLNIAALSGMELDREIAERLGMSPSGHTDGQLWVNDGIRSFPFSPTSDWAQLGPLVEKYRIGLYPSIIGFSAGTIGGPGWAARDIGTEFRDLHLLTAASRALLSELMRRKADGTYA